MITIKPLRLLPSAVIFLSAAALLYLMTHLCISLLAKATGIESVVFWFLCGGLGVFTPLIVAGAIMLLWQFPISDL